MQKLNGSQIKTFARQLSGSVADELLFPRSVMPGVGCIEILGREETVVRSCRGITEFDGETIILRMSDYLLKVMGEALTVRSFSSGCAIITGKLHSIEFVGGEK